MGGELVRLYSGPFMLGLTYGLTVCSWSCLPYIGPYIIGSSTGFGPGVKAVLTFSLGKLISYALLGALDGYLGKVLEYSQVTFVSAIPALLIIWLGCSLFFRPKGKCSKRNGKTNSEITHNTGLFPLIFLGITAGLSPCLPLSGVLLYAAAGHSITGGFRTALLFGMGTTISPLILMGGMMGWFSAGLSQKIPRYSPLFQKVCGLMLVSLGIKLIVFL